MPGVAKVSAQVFDDVDHVYWSYTRIFDESIDIDLDPWNIDFVSWHSIAVKVAFTIFSLL